MSETEPTGAYCPVCDGTGTLAHLHSMEGGASHVIAACATCEGTGLIPFPHCRRCADTGYQYDAEADQFDRCTCLGTAPRSAYLPEESISPRYDIPGLIAGFLALVVLLGAVTIALATP